jgi:hypothetical protein
MHKGAGQFAFENETDDLRILSRFGILIFSMPLIVPISSSMINITFGPEGCAFCALTLPGKPASNARFMDARTGNLILLLVILSKNIFQVVNFFVMNIFIRVCV